jgi:hypothetical protein
MQSYNARAVRLRRFFWVSQLSIIVETLEKAADCAHGTLDAVPSNCQIGMNEVIGAL